MEFYKEIVQRDIDYYSGVLERRRKKLESIPQETAILWEIGELVELVNAGKDGYYSVGYDSEYVLSCSIPPIEADPYEELLNDIDDIMEANGYILDIDYTTPSYYTGQEFRYEKEGEHSLKVRFSSTQCTMESTGKMVPETKQRCNLIIV